MVMSKEDAVRALQDIGDTRDRVRTFNAYRHWASYLMIWGAAWLVANSVMDLLPPARRWAWPAVTILAICASLLVGLQQRKARTTDPESRRAGRRIGIRFGLSFMAIVAFYAAISAILEPLTGREINAFISLFWALMYTLAGIWMGWRIAVVGVVVAALVLLGFFGLQSHFALWMGLVGGGTLFLGGLWLRRI